MRLITWTLLVIMAFPANAEVISTKLKDRVRIQEKVIFIEEENFDASSVVAKTFQEYDIDEQIRIAEDPNFLEYLAEKKKQHETLLVSIESIKKERRENKLRHIKARNAYIIWRDAQPVISYDEEIKELERLKVEENKFQRKLEKKYAANKKELRAMEMSRVAKIAESNISRLPASLKRPAVKRENRVFKQYRFQKGKTKWPLKDKQLFDPEWTDWSY